MDFEFTLIMFIIVEITQIKVVCVNCNVKIIILEMYYYWIIPVRERELDYSCK